MRPDLDNNNITGDWDVYEGQNISLICHANGNPRPVYTWYFNGQQLNANSRTTIKEKQLNIFNATKADGGEYTCVTSNRISRVVHKVDVIVKDISSIGISISTSNYIKEGTLIRFRCYRKDGFNHLLKLKLVKDKISFYNWGSLSVWDNRYTSTYRASQNYTGSYRCKGTVGAASRYSSPIDLKVGIPSGPIILEKEILEISTTGIKLSWKPISHVFWNGEQVTFQINVTAVDNTRQKSYVTIKTSVIISGLLPSTAYIVSVTGKTIFGPFQNITKIALKTEENKNSKKYQIRVRLTNHEFSSNLLDSTSRPYKSLKTKLEDSLNRVYRKSAIGFQYIDSTVSRFEKGSVVAIVVITLDAGFVKNPTVLVDELNKVDMLAGYKIDKLYTVEKDFDECEDADLNACHNYAQCENVPGTYICKCFEGFFGDGKECQGPPQIVAKSPVNITQKVETNVTLVCTVIADPNPIITWKRTDPGGKFIKISDTSDISEGNYSIYNARVEDSGIYLCNATNTLGYDSYNTEVIIKPVRVNIDVEISLSNKTFKEELNNKSSPAFKELAKDVYTELYAFFNNTPGFKDIEVIEFVNGSVKVIFRVIIEVSKPSKETNDVVAVKVGRKLSKQLLTGRIGNIMVVPKALKLRVPPPPPVNVTYSHIEETRAHIYWDPPELHEMFSIEQYYIAYRKHGERKWTNKTLNAIFNQVTNFKVNDLESDTFYILRIFAWNAFGLGKESEKVEVKTKKVEVVSQWYYIGPIIGVASVLLLVIIFCLVRRASQRSHWTLVDTQISNLDGKKVKTSFEMLERKKQNENTLWTEILRSSVKILDETLIPGEYGAIVAQGTLNGAKETNTCSLKMLKENASTDEYRDLMNELTTISSISIHENIVNLIGACTSDDGPLILLLEFCSIGTLESSLRETEKSKLLLRTKTKIRLENEIARGMCHLFDARIVHRDLASKNILLTVDFTPKISNFGQSRDIYERGTYRKLTQASLSSRWMAIESLMDGLFTTQSDVWSFGVVMWEIESGGCIPYNEFKVTDLVGQLHAGHRLPKPEQASKEIYQLMLNCWNKNPHLRPTFHEIVDITNETVSFKNQVLVDASFTTANSQ